ncbi:methyltransferase, partial [Paenibacillus forsythiae]
MKEIDDLLCRLLYCQLWDFGLLKGKAVDLDELRNQVHNRDFYGKWLEVSMAYLTHFHYLTFDGSVYTAEEWSSSESDKVWEEWDRVKEDWLLNPDTKSQAVLVETMLRALPDILAGKVLATEVMFPDSSMDLVEGIYKDNMVADYFNRVIADSAVAYIKERIKQDPAAQIRILEIGAGTGGTSAMVFKQLEPYKEHIREYCYTDLSKAFFIHAEKKYGLLYPYMTCRVFDLHKPVSGQGIDAGGYDLAIATNVLHATKNIRQTLRNVKVALRKNGLILLNELSGESLFTHLTFGLLEGWWLYEDSVLRMPGSPGLFPETWREVLETEGFRSTFFPAIENHDLGQQIIVAESDGIIRQQEDFSFPIANSSSAAKSLRNSNEWSLRNAPVTARITGIHAEAKEQAVRNHVVDVIRRKLSDALKVDVLSIDNEESFADYGLDSILGVHLVKILNESLHIELETTSLFDYSCVNQLTAFIMNNQRAALAGLFPEFNEPIGDGSTEVASEEAAIDYNNFRQGPDSRVPEQLLGETAILAESKDSIAIVGMSGRFAKSRTVDEL